MAINSASYNQQRYSPLWSICVENSTSWEKLFQNQDWKTYGTIQSSYFTNYWIGMDLQSINNIFYLFG